MKQSILLLAAGLMVGSAYGQESHGSMLFSQGSQAQSSTSVTAPMISFDHIPGANSLPVQGHKTTTAGGSRWYNYGGYQYNTVNGGDYTAGGFGGTSAPYMWFDTSSQDIYSGTPPLNFNTFISVSEVLDPMFVGFNDPTNFPGEIGVLTTSAYTIDSVNIEGVYERNHSDASTVDTLRITLTTGVGSSTSNVGVNGWEGTGTSTFPFVPYNTDTLLYLQTYHDSAKNVMTNVSPTGTTLGAAVFKMDILLHQSDTSGGYDSSIRLNSPSGAAAPLSVPAGSFPAMSLTFISGNAAAPHMPTTHIHYGDTVFTGDAGNPYRYGMFRPLVTYFSDGTGNPKFMPYTPGLLVSGFKATNDLNVGLFKQEPAPSWGGMYLPSWAFHSGTSSPSTLQYPAWGGMHIVCATCPYTESEGTPVIKTVKSVNVYPNPANSELNITFSSRVPVDVSLTNMLGQVVATQNAVTGQAVLNTSNIPTGVYIYTLIANGERTTGRVVIGH